MDGDVKVQVVRIKHMKVTLIDTSQHKYMLITCFFLWPQHVSLNIDRECFISVLSFFNLVGFFLGILN